MLDKYDEYTQVIESILKATGNFDVFNDFNDKIEKQRTPSQIQQTVLVLTSIAPAVKDKDLQLELYQKIIEELVLMVFNM